MKQTYLSGWVVQLLLAILSFCSHAQQQRYPANVSPVLNAPYSLYISDYTDPGKNQLVANIVFNDFNEPLWTFKLKLTIESNDIRLQTSTNFTPASPITVLPGVLTQVTTDQWVEYFDFNNLEITGAGLQVLQNSGRLPEGLYSFCLEVLDYETEDPLSRETCTTAWIQLSDPARLISPACGLTVDPKLAAFPFQWQLFNTTSPNASTGTDYQLTIWELTEPGADPLQAVPNGQALQVFRSEFITRTNFNYGPAEPLLELGKTYIWRVQAQSPDGRDSFKNNGYSEFCHFYYGWPEGGKIALSWPEEEGGFRSEEQPYLSWKGPDNLLPGQSVEYQVEVMEVLEGQTPEEAYVSNESWFSFRQPQTFQTFSGSTNIPPLEKSAVYAWKITAFTGEQKIAESEISSFNGPSMVEFFYAGNHRVNVDYINGKDVSAISGGGAVRITNDPHDWTSLTFQNISLRDNGGYWIMDSGEIFIDISQPENIVLTPEFEDNGSAMFEIGRYRLDNVGLYAYGTTHWDLPFATLSTEKAVVHSVRQWANYNEFKVNAVVRLQEDINQFDLLDPYDFTIDLDTSSLIYINSNRFRLDFNGDVYVPEKISRYSAQRAAFPFQNATDLFYIRNDSVAGFSNPVQPLRNTQYWMRPSSYIIDLSEKESPGIQKGDPWWKGIDIISFGMTWEPSPDHKGQLEFDSLVTRGYHQNGQSRFANITAQGLSMHLQTDYENLDEQLKFQTFPSTPLTLNLEIADNQVSQESYLSGDFLIPFISLSDRFGYQLPVNNQGFEKGFLTDLEGTEFTFNPQSGDQEIFVTVQRAVLSGNERISMTIDMDWPGLDVHLTGLRDFKVWGDYSVGFATKNGTVALEQRTNALMGAKKYPVTIDIIGAGSFDGKYMFATTADIVLGEDVSGPEDAPKANIYSAVANPFVPENADGGIGDLPEQGPTLEEAVAELEQEMEAFEESLLAKLDENSEQLVADAEAYQAGIPTEGTVYATEDLVDNDQTILEVPDGELKVIAVDVVERMKEKLLPPLYSKAEDISSSLTDKIEKPFNDAKSKINDLVDNLVGNVADQLVSTLQNDKIAVAPIINEIAQVSREALKLELTSSLDLAVQNNVVIPVESLLMDGVVGLVRNHITDEGSKLVYALVNGRRPDFAGFYEGMPGVIAEAMQNVTGLVSIENLESTVIGLGEDLVKNMDMGGVASQIRGEATNKIKEALAAYAGDLAADMASNLATEAGLPAFAGGDNPIDFAGMGSRLAEGDYVGAAAEVFLVDPIPLNMVTPIVELAGMVHYTPNDPIYGDVWSGNIDMKVKVPKPFVLNATYINGRMESNSYWFVEIRGNDEEGEEDGPSFKLGDPIPKEAKQLANPVNMGIANMVGISGRLYHHMSETEDGGIIPDPDMRFGAYMNVVFFDKNTGGKNMRLAVAGEINTQENGDYTLEFLGDLQIRSESPDVVRIDDQAPIQGSVIIKYNSAEKHFFGLAEVELFKENVICANGSLLVDVKPGAWRVALGTRDKRLRFVPGCTGWSPTGWLDINQNEAELGLGLEWSIRAKTPTINIIVYKVNFGIEAGLAAGILAAVQYNPKLALARAGLWADLYARVVMNHKKLAGKWKSLTLIDISLSGDLIVYFIPKPTTLEGTLSGRIKVLFFNKTINANVEMEL